MSVVEVTTRQVTFPSSASSASSLFELQKCFDSAETDGVRLVLLRFPDGCSWTPSVGLGTLQNRLHQAGFVSVAAVDGDLRAGCSELAAACDFMLLSPASTLRFTRAGAPGLPHALRGRAGLGAQELSWLGLAELAATAREVDAFVRELQPLLSASPSAIRQLRAATTARHGGQDLSRVVLSLSSASD